MVAEGQADSPTDSGIQEAGPGVGRAHSLASQETKLWFLPLVSSVVGTWGAGALSTPLLPEAAPTCASQGEPNWPIRGWEEAGSG